MKKEPDDRGKLKIASFRTTDGDWFDFSQVAESNGLTATDVLKACMVEYQAGTYTPAINTPVSMRIQSTQGLTAEEVQELINTAISTVCTNNGLTVEQVTEIARDEANKATQPIFDDLLELKMGHPSKTKPTAIQKTKAPKHAAHDDGRVTRVKLNKKHGLNIKTMDTAEKVKKALSAAGLDCQYRYDSKLRVFYPR